MPDRTIATLTRCEDLSRYRYYTGAQPLPVLPEESCPPLFRDVGLEAMTTFLRGGLTRLCGPVSPVTFLRAAEYREPYTDYGRIGRIMLLRPQEVRPWHSGIDAVYISAGDTIVQPDSMVFIPSRISLSTASRRYSEVTTLSELQECFGAREYRDAIADTLDRLDHLKQSHAESERIAAPLRRLFQSMQQQERDRARELMQKVGLSECDLCTAWHHLPDERRAEIRSRLPEIQQELSC
ncbi:MAG: hypothetical protein R3C59_14120 [Planctomycetaceae bacterium]